MSKTIKFIQVSRQSYADVVLRDDNVIEEDFNIHVYIGDRFLYEFKIIWKRLGVTLAAQVMLFDDAWEAFRDLPDLFGMLASLSAPKHDRGSPVLDSVTPERFRELLLEMGAREHEPSEHEPDIRPGIHSPETP